MAGVGTRVVRGPDWKWGKQDGGDGRVGTLRSYETHEEVMVIWDAGTAANYRCASHFDLRILDNSITGIHHETYSCNGCQSTSIYGIRWECMECPTINLCSLCYHGDKHSLRHQFYRISTPSSKKVSVPVRKKSKKISSRGVFPGARVVRGLDWNWDDQDGGEGHKGKVTKIESWNGSSPRSAASVVWDHGVENLYRIGFEGMVDVKVVTEAKGYTYYRDHLPLVGEEIQVPEGYYEVGDNVCVDSDPDTVRYLQHGHGGWAESMREIIGVVGVVSGIDEDGDIVVQYPSGSRWTFNPVALKKATVSPVATGPQRTSLGSMRLSGGILDNYLPGDVVKVSSDTEYVKRQQQGHGDWVDSMAMTLGQVGRVIEVVQSGDIIAEVCGTNWTFSPAVLTRLDTEGAPLTPGTSQNVSVMLRQVFESHQASNPVEELFKAAASGDIGRVEEVLGQGLCTVDESFDGQTPLHIACQNGYRDVVRFLINKGANPEEEDKDGDQAIHFATIGDEPDIIELLASHGVDLNTRNRRQQTPLHIAVTKGYIIVIECLLKHNCHPSLQDAGGDTPLHDAISKKRDDITELLLEGGADITVTNSNGFNCLHHASLRGNLGAVRLLLQHLPPSCDVDTPKDDGFTALHLATLNNHIEVAKTIIQHGANVDGQTTTNRQTPLHLAVERQNSQIVRLLVEEDANVNIPDRYGDTPLHCAIRQHTLTQLKELKESPQDVSKMLTSSQKKTSSSVAIFLASHGADFSLTNSSNQRPLDLCSDPSLIKTLQKCQEEYQSKENGGSDVHINKCMKCHSLDRDVLFSPCGHVTVCSICSSTVTSCSLCDTAITSKTKIDECLVCSERPADILFKPCLHMVACESCATVMKKCVHCRAQVEETVARIVCQGGKATKRKSFSKVGVGVVSSEPPSNLSALQQQLQVLKEKNLCAVCMDRRKNCVFLCGHGTCQPCADKLTECPICRKPVEKKIITFD